MARPGFSPRERRLALVAGNIILIWAVLSWAGLPLVERFAQLRHLAIVSQKKLTRLRELAARKPLIEKRYQDYASFKSDDEEELIQGAFLDELEQLARADNLQINLKPRPMQRTDRVSRIGVELDTEATQEGLLSFLDRLLTQPILIELERLRISTTTSKERPLRASLFLNKVVVRD